jgi:hypothetical protein
VIVADSDDGDHHHHRYHCVLTPHYTKVLTDRVQHYMLMFFKLLDQATLIFIEQQPPIVAVEQLIFEKYRHKAILVSPKVDTQVLWNAEVDI